MFSQMYETYPGETANANINQHLDEVTSLKPVQIRQEVKGHINNGCDPFNSHLPLEITSHIFAIYTEEVNSSFDLQRPSTGRDGPLLLAAVSKLWREVAFSTPQLWNTLNIHVRSPTDNVMPKVELTKEWLDRSGQLPLCLSLRLRIPARIVERASHSLRPLFKLIRNFAPRWHVLALVFSTWLYSIFLDDLTCAPRLHTLKLICAESYDEQFRLAQTPSLKNFEISSHLLSRISVEWGGITNFEAGCLSTDEFFEILRLAGRLTSCRLHGMNQNIHLHPIPTIPLMHSALRQLRVCPGESDYPERRPKRLFDLLVFPSLERFGYKGTSKCTFPLNSLVSLFNRSHCQLTHLNLSGNLLDVTADDIISLLSALPTITHFKLEDIEDRSDQNDGIMTDHLLQKLTPIESTAVLLPCLQSLKFRGKQAFSWKCLADFISAGLVEENDHNSDMNPTTNQIDVNTNSPVVQHQNQSRNPIRLVSFIVIHPAKLTDPDIFLRFNRAHAAGVSIEIVDENWLQPSRRSLLQNV